MCNISEAYELKFWIEIILKHTCKLVGCQVFMWNDDSYIIKHLDTRHSDTL